MSVSITPATVARLRLAAQGLLPTSTTPTPGVVDVVRSLTALQGQDLPGVLWSIGVRAPGSVRSDVATAFAQGELVRSWPLRGTLHVTAAEDLGWLLSLTAGRMLAAAAPRHRQLEITDLDVGRARELALRLLGDGGVTGGVPGGVPGHVGDSVPGMTRRAGRMTERATVPRATRAELFAAFEAGGQRTSAQRGIHLLWLLCVEGTLVQGPLCDGGQTFVRTSQWITRRQVLPHDEALAELARRYFRSHGPATLADLAWWAKLPRTEAALAVALLQGELETVVCQGATLWLAPETAALLAGPAPGARSVLLLPGFDELLLGYTDRSASLDAVHAPQIVPGGNGMFLPTVVCAGRVAGTWRAPRTAAERAQVLPGGVLAAPFTPLSPARTAGLARAAQAYARFLAG